MKGRMVIKYSPSTKKEHVRYKSSTTKFCFVIDNFLHECLINTFSLRCIFATDKRYKIKWEIKVFIQSF